MNVGTKDARENEMTRPLCFSKSRLSALRTVSQACSAVHYLVPGELCDQHYALSSHLGYHPVLMSAFCFDLAMCRQLL